MKINDDIFREYDVRGVVDRDLCPEFAYLLGRAYAIMARQNNRNNLAVGFDTRHSSPPYSQAFAKGLSDEGVDSCITGMGPTPQLYYAIFKNNYGGGVQVTGSHNPPDMNGFKLCMGTAPLSGEEIQALKQIVLDIQNKQPSAPGKGRISQFDMRPVYTNELIENSRAHMGGRKLKVVVDAGNGVGGLVGPQVLKALGVDVIELFCEPDGSFPNHHPDPTVLKYIEKLIKTVRETGADFGIGWDGDADRIGVVDEKGDVIFGDMLLLIYARQILKEAPGSTIIGDVKCSARVFDDIKKRGGTPIMWKTGHSLIKKKVRDENAAFGGEMSGHMVFNHRYYGFDDAIYSTSRFVEIASAMSGPVSQLLADLPSMVSTPEIRVDCPEQHKFKIAEQAKSAFPEYQVTSIDGARIAFENGWALIRASNTQPILVMRFEADTPQHLEQYQRLVLERIEKIKQTL